MSEKRYFFTNDDDGHDYIVPTTERKLFTEMHDSCMDENGNLDYDATDKFETVFGECRIPYSISWYSFTDPLLTMKVINDEK